MKKIICSLSIIGLIISCESPVNKAIDKKNELVEGPFCESNSHEQLISGEILIAQSDCLACHKKEIKLVGPSFIEIAKKYSISEENIKLLSNSIKNGSSGNWGLVAMQPHSNLSEDQVKEMVKYILSFNEYE